MARYTDTEALNFDHISAVVAQFHEANTAIGSMYATRVASSRKLNNASIHMTNLKLNNVI